MKKILVADSIKESRDAISRSLEVHGFQCKCVSSGRDIIELDHEEVMLVIMAQHLQDMSAIDVVETIIRDNPYFSEIPFIICTSDNSNTFYRKCLAKGFTEVLHKPFSRKSLFNMIKNILVEKGILDEEMFMGVQQVEEIKEKEKVEFLKHLFTMQQPGINPKYNSKVNTGYFYPTVTEYFSLTPGEEYSLLDELAEDHILSRKVEDKVNICPRCSFHTLNYREICPKCSSLDIQTEEVYHHFSCGYVGPSSDFHTGNALDEITCPKCEKRLRHIGLDYEKPSDTFVCHECKYVFTEPDVDFKCFSCSFIAPAEKAIITRIYSYTPTKRAEKAVENNSLSIYNFNDIIMSENRFSYNLVFFNYMLKRKTVESNEFKDENYLAVIGVQNVKDDFYDSLAAAISKIISPLDIMAVTEKKRIAVLFLRKNQETVVDDCRGIRDYLVQSLKIQEGNEPPFGIIVRNLGTSPSAPEDVLKETLDVFETKCKFSKGEIFLYEEE
ncbi:MAG: hypothetical protein A2020_13725 [Lentisphaerae bacterium GWF2_45_14]|nr:MAG: hypothetical protein A2020_13725 [Lentisphaerae bacterium GWF2_45_14]